MFLSKRTVSIKLENARKSSAEAGTKAIGGDFFTVSIILHSDQCTFYTIKTIQSGKR